jgi:hypothetical protein
MDITAKRALRTAFMTWLFNESGGSELGLAQASHFGVPLGWEGDLPGQADVADVVKYLEGEYLLRAHWTMGGLPSVQLTHAGIREVEEALASPSQQTEHFVPLVNITNIHGSVIGSQLQQGSPGASQAGTFEINQREGAEAFVAAAQKILDNEEIDPKVRGQVNADLSVMSNELASPSPRWPILQTFGTSVRDYLLKAVGAAAGAGLIEVLWP